MTTFTLTMAIVGVLVVVLASVDIIVGSLVWWTGHRMGDVSGLRGEIDTLRTQIKNLDDFLDTYRKRDANRVSAEVQREKRQRPNGAASTPSTPQLRPDIASLFTDGLDDAG